MKVYVHKDYPLALRGSIKLHELKYHPIVFYRSKLSEKFINDFTQQHGSINLLFTSNSTDAINKSIREGLAISVIPDFCLNDDPHVLNGDIVPIEIADYSGAHVSFGWIRSKLHNPTHPVLKFIEYLDYEFNSHYAWQIKNNHSDQALSRQSG
jgi:DNA-binding transcriptional LysR family regulator